MFRTLGPETVSLGKGVQFVRRFIKRSAAILVTLLLVLGLPFISLAETVADDYIGRYHHLDINMEARFKLKVITDGVPETQTLDATVSDLFVFCNGIPVLMGPPSVDPIRNDYEFASCDRLMWFYEHSVVVILGKLTYTLNSQEYTIDFFRHIVLDNEDNLCGGTPCTPSYGFDLTVPACDIQRIVTDSTLNVLKVWNDDDYSGRPESISINILRSEGSCAPEIFSTETLLAEDDWGLTLSGLPNGYYNKCKEWVPYTYDVEEVAVSGYTTEKTKGSGIITLTNTLIRETTQPEETTTGETSEVAETTVEETTAEATTSDDTNLTTESVPIASATTSTVAEITTGEIPQTGERAPSGNALIIGLILLALAGSLALVLHRRKTNG
jgi:LPXTG-motif cell wall-anchored protein